MFDRNGVGIDDLAWIRRDQYVHYTTLAHQLGDPHDWPRFRHDLADAITAAFGLHPRRQRVLDLLDAVRTHHGPATNWPAFFDALWARRHEIRPDL